MSQNNGPSIDFFDYAQLVAQLDDTPLAGWADELPQTLAQNFNTTRFGDIPRWQEAYEQLPDISITQSDLASDVVVAGNVSDIDLATVQLLDDTLRKFIPWRKGPFTICGINIETEWRSDFKWNRLICHIEPLKNRTILDIGCGSGYHSWRMAGEGARLVVGIDPSPLFIFQYWVLQKYLQDPRVWVVPQRMEQMPANMQAFDTVFSMGILYHRRSPFDHLQELRQALRPGGQLVLETLVIEGDKGQCLVPEGRYSKMGNVWFIPSCATLESWLHKMKFRDIQLIDVSQTDSAEQHRTDWMQFESLTDFLDPEDSSKTVEGYPAPRRAVFVATKPE